MKPWFWTVLLVLVLVAMISGCEREERHFRAERQNAGPDASLVRQSINQPGMALGGYVKPPADNVSMYDDNAFAVNEGKRLYRWYNCNGCHANGGGSMGPPLMDDKWIYGSEPAQIVAYVRAMGGGVRTDVAPSRSDSLYPGKPENFRSPQPAIQKGASRAEQSLEVR